MTVTRYDNGIIRYIDDKQALTLGVIYCHTNAKTKKQFLKVAPLKIEFMGDLWLMSSIERDPLGQYTGIYTALKDTD